MPCFGGVRSMTLKLDEYQLADILKEAADLGAKNVLVSMGLLKPHVSLNDAYKLYARRSVDKLIKEGRLNTVKHGNRNSKVLIDRLELQALFTIKEFIVYFKNAA